MKNATIVLLLLTNTAMSYSQEWKTNLSEAFREASASGKEVLLLFSVTENCESCAKLEENVLQSNEFLSYANERFILVKQDFNAASGADKFDNLLIVEKYNKDGFFPLMVIINKNEKMIGQLGTYNNETPQQYIAKLQSAKKS